MNALSENNQNPKTMWNTIRTLTNKNSKTTNITEIHVENDLSVTEPKQIADAFNTIFNNIGTQLADALPVTNITPESIITPANSSFEIHTVSIEKVFNLLSTIKFSKTIGQDKISPKLLKDSADIVAPSLVNIFNRSIKTGIFPDEMKTAVISPIFKSGNKTECTNYRPISILSAISKIFEKLISMPLSECLESNEIFTGEQSGFRKNHSTH